MPWDRKGNDLCKWQWVEESVLMIHPQFTVSPWAACNREQLSTPHSELSTSFYSGVWKNSTWCHRTTDSKLSIHKYWLLINTSLELSNSAGNNLLVLLRCRRDVYSPEGQSLRRDQQRGCRSTEHPAWGPGLPQLVCFKLCSHFFCSSSVSSFPVSKQISSCESLWAHCCEEVTRSQKK